MKSLYKMALVAGIAILTTSCFNKRSPNYQYFPNMYESVAYETYVESDAFARGGVSAQLPADGTIKRGFVPYEYENSTAGYESAKANLTSPLDATAYNEERAKYLYDIYCAVCHGETGDGKGVLVKKEKYLGVPSYKDREITVGSVFHVETYGLNAMGSYANQLNPEERWQVAEYVMKLKAGL
jgi:mono/diheme cytochrome c family protein